MNSPSNTSRRFERKGSSSTCAAMAAALFRRSSSSDCGARSSWSRWRATARPQTNPPQTFLGPMVALINEFSASDGDIFPYRFKTLGLGKLIGKRTWGGVIGIRNPLPLLMAASSFRPEFAPYSKDGKGLGHRKPWRRSRHRGRQRSGEGIQRRRPAARSRPSRKFRPR